MNEVEHYLDGLINEALLEIDSASPATEQNLVYFRVHHVRGIAEGLMVAGALASDTATAMLHDFDSALTDRGHIQVINRRMATLNGRPGASDPALRVGAQQPHTSSEFLRVIPLGWQLTQLPGSTLMSLDMWSDGFELRYAYLDPQSPATPPQEPSLFKSEAWTATDDLGGRYTTAGKSRTPPVEAVRFRPAVASGARRLVLTVSTLAGGSEDVEVRIST